MLRSFRGSLVGLYTADGVLEKVWGPRNFEDEHGWRLDSLVGRLMGPEVDLGELFFQHQRHESWSLEDGIVKDGSHNIDQGVGVRAISGEKTGFAYSDDLSFNALTAASRNAGAIARLGLSQGGPIALKSQTAPALYQSQNPIDQHERFIRQTHPGRVGIHDIKFRSKNFGYRPNSKFHTIVSGEGHCRG